MEFRKSVEADINDIMRIINQAQAYLKSQGVDQWQNNYPNHGVIAKDIAEGISYVLLIDGKIVGTAVISFDGERTYNQIYEGQWLSDRKYAVVHRMAVDGDYKGRGLASMMFGEAEKLSLARNIYSIRVDTHEQNLSMQRALEKNGFQYCGIIYLADQSKRLAYEKLL